MPSETMDWPPNYSVIKSVLSFFLAAYTAAATPAGPPPTIITSYIGLCLSNLQRFFVSNAVEADVNFIINREHRHPELMRRTRHFRARQMVVRNIEFFVLNAVPRQKIPR